MAPKYPSDIERLSQNMDASVMLMSQSEISMVDGDAEKK